MQSPSSGYCGKPARRWPQLAMGLGRDYFPAMSTPSPEDAPLSLSDAPSVGRKVATGIALGLGVLWFCLEQRGQWVWTLQCTAAIGAAVLALVASGIPAAVNAVARGFNAVCAPSAPARGLIAVTLGLGGAAYLWFSAHQAGRVLIPFYHDEHMYLLQARMLAHGHLWMSAHPLPQFFETFHVFVKPVYSSIYFPGTALMYAPHVWLHVPYWVISLAVSGAILSLTYLTVTRLIDGVAGLLGALFLIALNWFRYLALMPMSHPVVLLLGLLMVWTWLQWRPERKPGWAILFGAFTGWAAITRPLDALCFAVPLGVATLLELRHSGIGKPIKGIVLMGIAAAPFIALQLRMDVGVTGHILETPATRYNREYWPESSLSLSGEIAESRPPTPLLQIQEYYDGVIVKQISAYRRMSTMDLLKDRFQLLVVKMLPSPLLLVLLPAGLLQLDRRRRWAFAAMLPLLVGAYVFYPFFLAQYALIAAPALLLIVLLGGAEVVGLATGRWRTGLELVVVLVGVALAVAALPELQPAHHVRRPTTPLLVDVNRQLRGIKEPAIVLLRFTAADDPKEVHSEPVYNIDVANPDDARVIRAHDLGVDEDKRLIAYYAARQPTRVVYLYLRKERKLVRWGDAKTLMSTTLRYPEAASEKAIGR